jgi:hypothetical protein
MALVGLFRDGSRLGDFFALLTFIVASVGTIVEIIRGTVRWVRED